MDQLESSGPMNASTCSLVNHAITHLMYVSLELQDGVELCSDVGELGRGKCAWLSWNASIDRTLRAPSGRRVANGSQLIAFTSDSARSLSANWHSAAT